MKYCNKIVCVTYEDLTSGVDAVMNRNTLRSLLNRNKHLRVSEGVGRKCALIDYYNLPLRYRLKFEEKYGDLKELLRKKAMKATLRLDTEARKFFEDYRYEKGGMEVALPVKLIEEYTINASVLNILWDRYEDCRTYRKTLGGPTRGAWDAVEGTCEELRDSYEHTLPTNLARLRDRMNRYKKEGYSSLISGKVGNKSAAVITGEAARCIIALKRSRTPVYTDSQLLDEYNSRARENGWKQLRTVKALQLFLNRPEVVQLWYGAVHGELKAHQMFSRRHDTELPMRRDTLWYGDGTKLNFYYKAIEGGRTVVRTTSVYEVIDAYSEAFIGYHISDHEDYEAQYNAYRMAVQVSGHKPYELVCDNQGGHKKLDAQGFFKKICHIYRPTASHNGPSKTIESAFGRFQSQVLHKAWYFTGQNVTAKKDASKPNIEFVNANADKLPTLKELKEIYAEFRREWNEMPHPATGQSRIEMYRNSVNPDTQEVTVDDMVDIFWLQTDKPVTYTSSGLKITIKGETYQYEVYKAPFKVDHSFLRKNIGRRFIVKYDPYDMRSVRLYTEDERAAGVAETKIRIHRASQEQEGWEAAFIRGEEEANRQDRIEREAEARAIEFEFGTAPEQNGLNRPKLAGINKKQSAVQREIERRQKKYSRNPEALTPGEAGKKISQMIYNPQSGGIDADEYRMAGKL